MRLMILALMVGVLSGCTGLAAPAADQVSVEVLREPLDRLCAYVDRPQLFPGATLISRQEFLLAYEPLEKAVEEKRKTDASDVNQRTVLIDLLLVQEHIKRQRPDSGGAN